MPRPLIDGWFDSTITIWRPISTTDDIAAEKRTYVQMATVGAKTNRSRTPVAPAGGGLAPQGALRWYGRPDIDVQVRDICEVMTGPDAGFKWEVNENPVHPGGHHTQVDCVEWHGILETAS